MTQGGGLSNSSQKNEGHTSINDRSDHFEIILPSSITSNQSTGNSNTSNPSDSSNIFNPSIQSTESDIPQSNSSSTSDQEQSSSSSNSLQLSEAPRDILQTTQESPLSIFLRNQLENQNEFAPLARPNLLSASQDVRHRRMHPQHRQRSSPSTSRQPFINLLDQDNFENSTSTTQSQRQTMQGPHPITRQPPRTISRARNLTIGDENPFVVDSLGSGVMSLQSFHRNNSSTSNRSNNSFLNPSNILRPPIHRSSSHFLNHRGSQLFSERGSNSQRNFNVFNVNQEYLFPHHESGIADEPIEAIFSRLEAEEEEERRTVLQEEQRAEERRRRHRSHLVDQLEFVRHMVVHFVGGEPNTEIDPTLLALSLTDRDFNESDYESLLLLDETIPHKTVDKNSLSLLEKRKVSEEELKEEKQCPVCLGCFEKDCDVTILPCHHLFHTECIHTWLEKYSNHCPVCKAHVADLVAELAPTKLVKDDSRKRKRTSVINLVSSDSEDEELSTLPRKRARSDI